MKRRFAERVSVNFVWDRKILARLRQLAARMSLKRRTTVRVCDLVREAVAEKYGLTLVPGTEGSAKGGGPLSRRKCQRRQEPIQATRPRPDAPAAG